MSIFKSEVNFNGSSLLVHVINALCPEISEMSQESKEYIEKLDTTVSNSNWDLLFIIPELHDHIKCLVQLNSPSMDSTYTCIYSVFSRCKDAHFKHRIMTWNTHHEKDKNHGAKKLKFLKSCVTYVHKSISMNSWILGKPAT
ncbi:predicted protein [Chaetoceros tenuissimus]|uniref:Uncharacterized protein n=1 Tax=Chaetoceros tenuissimus TaxID=426638 RepID=A0AAD3D808_9STRA|nr:predicted protein [Chaetoceros tenuissimus]